MSQTDSHEPNQGELSGEVTNRLLMDMPQSPRRAQNRALTFLGVSVFLIVVAGIGFFGYFSWTTEKSGIVSFDNISYPDYARKVSTKEFDPRGASAIYYRREPGPEGAEGYELWMKMSIPRNSYDALLRQRKGRMTDLDQRGVKVRNTSVSKIDIPTEWQDGDADNPLWWEEIRNVRSADARSNIWELTARGMRRGIFWGYDPGSENLYIWEWEAPADQVNSGSSGKGSNADSDQDPDAGSNPDDETDPETDSDSSTADK